MFSRHLLCFSSSLHLITYVHLQCNVQISQEYYNLSAFSITLKFLKFTHKNHVYLMSKQETAVSMLWRPETVFTIMHHLAVTIRPHPACVQCPAQGPIDFCRIVTVTLN